MEMVDVVELLTDVRTSFSGQVEAAGVAMHVEIQGDKFDKEKGGGQLVVEADAERLDQIISNLVANALRHTPKGGKITLKAENGVRIFVQDTGEGIASEDLPNIFDRFWKGDRSRSRADGSGSGLGLAISRKLV
jgi:two-component system sensor histidine kinase BaeS